MGAPGVEVHCFFGYGVPTPSQAIFNGTNFSQNPPEVHMEDGDGTILAAGLRGQQKKAVHMYPIQGLMHGHSLHNKKLMRMFLEILQR